MKKKFIPVFVLFFTALLDQISKYFVVLYKNDLVGKTIIPFIFSFDYTENSGIAWGMLKDKRWIFMAVSIISIIVGSVLLYVWRNHSLVLTTSLAMIVGGATGNMIDRFFRVGENGVPYVVDFIKTDFIDFPYFNIADSAICVGAVIFFVFVLFFSDKEPLFPQRKKDAEK